MGDQDCFSGSSSVQTPGGQISIKSLTLNDSILTFVPGQGPIFTKFLGWLDRSSSAPNKFLKISTSNSGLITLSGSHVIFRSSNSGALESVYASQLVVGDKLVRKKEEV